jgi:hypothetical protein
LFGFAGLITRRTGFLRTDDRSTYGRMDMVRRERPRVALRVCCAEDPGEIIATRAYCIADRAWPKVVSITLPCRFEQVCND